MKARKVRKFAGRTVVVVAVVAANIALAIALMKPSRTTGDTMPPTTTTVPLISDPHPVIHSIDPTTVPARPPSATGKAVAGSRGTAAVSWTLSGSCTHTATTFACHVTLTSSDRLQSAGYINVYPATTGQKGCDASAPLAHDGAAPGGHCTPPFATNVLAVYALGPFSDAPALATAHLPWS